MKRCREKGIDDMDNKINKQHAQVRAKYSCLLSTPERSFALDDVFFFLCCHSVVKRKSKVLNKNNKTFFFYLLFDFGSCDVEKLNGLVNSVIYLHGDTCTVE